MTTPALILPRRAFLRGLAGILAVGVAPAIVRASSLMPVKMGHGVTWLSPGGNINTWGTALNAPVALRDLQRIANYLNSRALNEIMGIDGQRRYMVTLHPTVAAELIASVDEA